MLIFRFMEMFLKTEASSGIVLAFSALIAMVMANSTLADSYFAILNRDLFGLSFQHWINDGLMAIFFFVVGMEIKRELVAGELRTLKKAALPIAGALGGMLVPALVYLWFNPAGLQSKGWAIPMATDIAFAIGVLALLGKRVPLSLKIFLLALAIVDDLGAVLVIAIFYTEEIRTLGLLTVALGISSIFISRRFGFTSYLWYIPFGFLVWAGMLYSGVHATIAGIILGFVTPRLFKKEEQLEFSPLNDLIHIMHPWVSFGIMPVFALANAGIFIGEFDLNILIGNTVTMGVGLGLLIGKPFGVFVASIICVFLGFATLPRGLRWGHIMGASMLAGIGFTMAIFISNLSLFGQDAVNAKIAILGASLLAAFIGYCVLIISTRESPEGFPKGDV